MTIDTILFDLDDTLVEYEKTTQEMLEATYEKLEIEPIFSASAYVSRFDEFLDESEDLTRVRANCFGALAEERGYDRTIGQEMADVYSRIRDPAGVQCIEGATEALDALSAEFSMGIVTNGPPQIQRPKIESVGLDQWTDTVVCGGFDTPAKPSAEPFDLALDRLGASADEAVVVGNSLQSDIAGARAAGITSVWIPTSEETPGDIRPDYHVNSLTDLLPPIWRA